MMSVWAALVSTKKKKMIFFSLFAQTHSSILLHAQFPVVLKNDFNLYFLAAPYPKEQQEQRIK